MDFVQCLINSELSEWLKTNNFKINQAKTNIDKGSLILIYNDNVCLKVYDCMGHGFGITINLTNEYNESIYENDLFNIEWVFKYFKITQNSSFNSRLENEYIQNLPKQLEDIKSILSSIMTLDSFEWDKMVNWIENKALKS